jgi:phosphatidylserine/phosphatidylglycerophosphate/cardiolipin synthase-like enzyme
LGDDFVKLGDLAGNVRIKRGGPFMHLKAYEIDGTLLRTGSAKFSTSGENAQDNDLIVIRGSGADARFETHFQRMWDVAQPMIDFEPAIKALEPKLDGPLPSRAVWWSSVGNCVAPSEQDRRRRFKQG